MAEIFLSLDEAAELEGVEYLCLHRRIQRDPSGYIVRTEKQPDGGRDRVLVALSSLSKKARRSYKKRQGLDAIGGDIVLDNRTGLEVPWYVDVDASWYRENYGEQYDRAMDLAREIKAFLDYNEADRTTFAEEFAAEMHISQRTLYRYAETYLEAESWGLKLYREKGENYAYLKILALCRKPKSANTFPSLLEEHRAYIENVWFNKDFAHNLGTVEMLYSQFVKYFENKGMEYPSYQTVTRYIKYLLENKRMKNAHYLAEKGEREYKRSVMQRALRDTSNVPVLGIVQGDSHTLDFWVEYRDPDNGKMSAIRPTMVAWIDTRSRVVMGCVMAKTVNSQVVKQSMMKLVYEHGVPQCILIDNGKDYTAKEMTGHARYERNKLLTLGKDEIGFYKSVGILDDYRALPYQPWSKGPIERFFGTVCEQFSKWFTSYTGTLTGSKTAAKVQKDVKKLLAQGKLYTMEEAYQLYNMWLQDTYHQKPHRGLQRIGERYTKPMELFMKADRIEIPPPPKELAQMLLMKPGKARIYQSGINKFGHNYMNYALTSYITETLPIRWDPSDVSKLYVYDHSKKLICEVECKELMQYQGLISEKQLLDHIKEQKAQLAQDKRRLEEVRTPYELRDNLGDPRIAGKLDLMLEPKAESNAILATAKVISVKDIENESVESSYFEQQGKDALKKIRELG